MHGYYDVNGKLVIKKTERLAGVYVGRWDGAAGSV